MKINESPTRSKFPLSKKKIIKKTIVYSLFWNILVLLVVVLLSIGNGLTVGLFFSCLVASLIVTLPVFLYQRWYFATYYYELTDNYIIIKKNPITPKEITIPYERVQDVYVDQDIFDRLFGLYDVYLSSATVASSMEAHIDGVEKVAADGLKSVLLETVKSRISKK